nr:hypothetical protein [Tanacetum cinerariifolium]
MQTQTSNTLHNVIMEAGGKDHLPMLAQDKDVPVAEGSTETTTKRYMENYKNVSQDIRDQLNAKAESKAIERLKQGESINVQYLETNLYWEFRKFTSRDGESLESYYSRSQQATTRNRGKAIVNSPPLIYDQEPFMVAEDDEMSKEKEIEKLMALISLSFKKIYKPANNNLRTSSNTSRANQDNSPRISRGTGYENQRIGNVVGARETVGTTMVQKSRIQCYNFKEFGHVARECQKPKREKDATYHKERCNCELEAHYIYMAQIQEVNPDAADNSGPIFDTKPLQKVPHNDNYNVFAIESEHSELSKFVHDTYSIEQDEHNVIIDSLDMSYDREQVDQDDDDDLANERDLLASLIEKLKCEIDDRKNRNTFLETSNKALVDKLKGEIEDFKNKNESLESLNNYFKEANNELLKTNELMYKDLKKFQAELDRYNDVKYASKVEIDCAKAKGNLMSYKMEFEKSFNAYTRKINDLNQTISKMKKELFAHQETISILSQAKEAHLKFYKTREDKEIDKVIVLENKIKVLDNIVYKTGQSVQTMNMLNCNCKTSFAKPEFLKKAQRENPRLYDIENQSKEFRKKREQYFEIQDLKAHLQDKGIAISELKKLIEKLKGKSVDTKFQKSSIIRQPNAFRSQRPSILGKPTIFSDSLKKKDCSKSKSVTKNNVSNDFSKPVTTQILPQNKKSILKNINVLAPGMYKLYTEPIQTRTTHLPRDFRKPNKGVVMLNNSQEKKQEVEDHHSNVKFSKNKTSVTACNDSLNAKTSIVNFVCVTCGKCVLNDNHDKCVLHSHNNVNSRTKMPMAVPVSTREPKCIINQSVAKPLRRRVASESTNQIPRYTTRKLYEHVSKACSWWYPKFTPPEYKWKPMSQIRNVKPKVSMPLGNASRTANILEPITHRRSTVSHTTLYSNSFAARTDNLIHRRLCSRGTDLYSITLQDTTSPNPNWSKDETPKVLIDFLRLVQRGLYAQVRTMASDHVSSDPVPQCQRTALEHASLSPIRQCQKNVPQVAGTVTTSNELDLLFTPMFDDLLNGSSQGVSNSSAVTPADAPNQCQQQHTTPLNTQTTSEPTCQVPTQVPAVTSTKNINQAETITENAQEQVIGNPSQSIRIRRQLESDGEMCMFALTVSRTEPKNIKEAMADSAWIESMQEELHQFDRLDLRDMLKRKELISKNHLRQLLGWKLSGYSLRMLHTNPILYARWMLKQHSIWSSKGRSVRKPTRRICRSISSRQSIPSQEGIIWTQTSSKGVIHQSPRGIFINQAKYAQEILIKHGTTSCDSIGTSMATKHLDADLSGTLVDQTKYHSMVEALMYLTASRPDIVHATCYCARYQAKPTEKYLTAVKRIFRYLKDTIHMGLCKSTSGGIQFLGGDKLVSWSSKKQDCTSMSSVES